MEAARSLEIAIKLNPRLANSYYGLGSLFFEQSRYANAIRLYKRGLAVSTDPFITRILHDNLEQAEREFSLLQGETQLVAATITTYLPDDDPLAKIKRSIVLIYAEATGSKISGVIGKGTGFVIRRRGDRVWILTNRHVILNPEDRKPATRMNVEFFLGPLPTGKVGQRLPAQHVSEASKQQAYDYSRDLALIVVDGAPPDVQPLPLAADVPRGEESLLMIGHPAGHNWLANPLSLLKVTEEDDLLFDVSSDLVKVNPTAAGDLLVKPFAYGVSGSPVIRTGGEVVGIIYATDSQAGRQVFLNAYAIPPVRQSLRQWNIETP